jgi:hypothetical protein
MVQRHPSTPLQRAEGVATMIAHAGEYGVVTELSHILGVSRQTLYAWADRGLQALVAAFTPAPPAGAVPPALERAILTLLVEGHASVRGIQTCLRTLQHQTVRLETIVAVIAAAERRALAWLTRHAPAGARTVALDEIYGNNRHGGYLSVVDTASLAVWAAEGPLPVDGESWTLLLWLAQERGLRIGATVHDGGAALQAGVSVGAPAAPHGRDVWHLFHRCAQVQGRLDRRVSEETTRLATVQRQAARVAEGHRPRGRPPKTDVAAQTATLAQATRTADGVRYLSQEVRRLLAVVVLDHRGVLDAATRRQELDAALGLLAEVGAGTLPAQQAEVTGLHRQVTQALPGLLAFTAPLEAVQRDLATVLGADQLALVAWAWQRRAILGPTTDEVVAGFALAWQPAARVLITAWEGAVRASSAAETWHSLLRPHLAVHRTVSNGLLAVLAVWHNHRVFQRGSRRGQSPLHLSGMHDEPTDWLVALGYPPDDGAAPARLRPPDPLSLDLAA